MVSITLSVPIDMKKRMDTHPDINWSAVARGAIARKLMMLEKFNLFVKDSEITEEDALKYGAEVSKKAARRHKSI